MLPKNFNWVKSFFSETCSLYEDDFESEEVKPIPAVHSVDIPGDVPTKPTGPLHAGYHGPAYGTGDTLRRSGLPAEIIVH